jgi:hypothetical protein
MSTVTNAPGFGTTLSYGAIDYTGTPTAVPGIQDIDPPVSKRDAVQNSHMGTTAQTHTYQPGWKKPGIMKVSILWSATVKTALDAIDGVMQGWIITINDGTEIGGTTSTKFKFNGFIVGEGVKVPMEKLDLYEFEIQQSGITTYAAGS